MVETNQHTNYNRGGSMSGKECFFCILLMAFFALGGLYIVFPKTFCAFLEQISHIDIGQTIDQHYKEDSAHAEGMRRNK